MPGSWSATREPGGGLAVVGLAVALGLPDVRADAHRAQHGHADLVLAELPPQHLGERHDAVLGDAVRAEPAVRHEAGERRGEQDVAALALLDEAREERLDAVDRPPEVDVDRPPPVVVGHRQHRAADGDAGVVEHDVHRRRRRGRTASASASHGLQRPHVADDAVGVGPAVAQRLHGGVERALLDVGQHELGALRPPAPGPSPARCRWRRR